MTYQAKQIDKIIYFWDKEAGQQMLWNEDDQTGARLIEFGRKRYLGCWSSRPEVIRKICDKTFIGQGEIVDDKGVAWSPNIFKQNGRWFSMNDAGEEKHTNENSSSY